MVLMSGKINDMSTTETTSPDPSNSELTGITTGEDGILTVGRLREILANIADDVQVTLSDGDFGWLNVTEIDLPSEIDGIETVVMVPGSDFDPCQI